MEKDAQVNFFVSILFFLGGYHITPGTMHSIPVQEGIPPPLSPFRAADGASLALGHPSHPSSAIRSLVYPSSQPGRQDHLFAALLFLPGRAALTNFFLPPAPAP